MPLRVPSLLHRCGCLSPGENMVPKSSREVETRQGQSAVVRVRRGPKEQQRVRELVPRPVEVPERRQRGKDRRAHTGARQPVRGEEPTPAAGEVRLGVRPSPVR